MLCANDDDVPMNPPRDGFLWLLNAAGASTCSSSSMGSHTKAEPLPTNLLSFSWSDFPILGQESSDDEDVVPASVAIEDAWSASSEDSCSLSSEDSSVAGSLSATTLEHQEEVKKEAQRKVRFSSVLSIRTFDVTLGDHPCCVGGMALTCSWKHGEQDECINLDVYERYAPKRSMYELRLSYPERRSRLQAAMDLSPAQLLQLEYDMVCAAPMNALRPCSSVKSSLQELSFADL